MAFLRPISKPEIAPFIYGQGVYLRGPQMGDYAEWSKLREQSQTFLKPWEPVWAADDLTRPAYRRRLRRYTRDVRDEVAYPFFIFREEDEALVGGCTLSNIRRGVTQACSLGYWVGEPYARQGYVGAAVRALIPFVFEELGLHRLEAACLPTNEPSKRLLLKCGFTQEGYARDYLRINGAWRDHLLFAILNGDPAR